MGEGGMGGRSRGGFNSAPSMPGGGRMEGPVVRERSSGPGAEPGGGGSREGGVGRAGGGGGRNR